MHQVQQIVRVQMWTGEYQFATGHDRPIGHAPAIGVKHGRDREDHIAAAQSPNVGRAAHQGMQNRRAVRIDHALGLAGGARGVAHGHRVVFMVRHVLKLIAIGLFQKRFIVKKRRCNRCPRKREHDDFFKPTLTLELRQQRQQHIVHHQKAVFRVIGDPGDFVRCQAQIQGVHHPACSGYAEIALQVRMVVPTERGHPVARLQAQVQQGLAQFAGPGVKRAIAMAAQRFVGQTRDDLVAGKQVPGAVQQMVQRQVHRHHGAADGTGSGHGGGLSKSGQN